jgi:hypothetical protein
MERTGGLALLGSAKHQAPLSPGALSPINNPLNRTQAFTFLTHVPGPDGEYVDLLDIEQRKAQRQALKQVAAVKLKILDDFNRRLMNQDLQDKTEKVTKTAKKLWNLQ